MLIIGPLFCTTLALLCLSSVMCPYCACVPIPVPIIVTNYDDSDMFMEPLDDPLPSSSNNQPKIVPHNHSEDTQSDFNIKNSAQKNDRPISEGLGPLVSVVMPQDSIKSKLDDQFKEKDDPTPFSVGREYVTIQEHGQVALEDPTNDKYEASDAKNEEAQPIITVLSPQEPQSAPSDLQGRDTRSWYPSFGNWQQPPLGHSRPFYNTNHQQERAYSQRSDPLYQQEIAYAPQKFLELRGYKDQFRGGSVQQQVQSDANVDILGDGNFGVIQGGTFYPEKDSYDAESSDHFDDFSYFGPNNGHGRPSSSFYYGGKPNPKPHTHKQFENFRDFAEINAGVTPERQYSHYVVVYTNKNATNPLEDDKNNSKTNLVKTKPKNIIEQLTMLDLETQKTNVEEEVPEKKMSKSKRKLALVMPDKKHKARLLKKEREMQSEPLLALS